MAILSEIARRQVLGRGEDSENILSDIAESSRNVVDSMSDIVWAIDPRRDDLTSVVFRVRQFASELLTAKHIGWQFQTMPEFDNIKLNPEQRRQIFLIFKEAINNSVRHAKCNSLHLSLKVGGTEIIGEIRDDGCGFTVPSFDRVGENHRTGHGLDNLRSRATQLGGRLSIDSSPDQGTWIQFSVPLKKRMA
jgi:signal transduction histidine kinase